MDEDEDEEMAELRAQEAKRVRDEAKKCLRHASFQLGKAAYEIDEFLKEFSIARIPIRRQVILNEAIAHLVANVLPNLGIAEMARVPRVRHQIPFSPVFDPSTLTKSST